MTDKLIGYRIVEPSNRKEKAYTQALRCSVDDCKMFEETNRCIHILFLDRCPYGRYGKTSGYTKRARKYREWIKRQKENHERIWPNYAIKKAAIVGEYVWLPYNTANWVKSIPFLRHGVALSSGLPFVKLTEFKAEHIVALVKHRPRAMMGGEITDYQREAVPQMLGDLSQLLPELYAEAVRLEPSIANRHFKLENIASVTLSLRHIPAGWKWRNRGRYNVIEWDGETITVQVDNVPVGLWNLTSNGPCECTLKADLTKSITLTNPEHIAYFLENRPDQVEFKAKR